MSKEKIAISIDSDVLSSIDHYSKLSALGSRSQTISYLVQKGLEQQAISTAVILLHSKHVSLAQREVNGKTLFEQQLSLFADSGITHVFVLCGDSPNSEALNDLSTNSSLSIEIIQKETSSNAEALLLLKDRIQTDFFVLAGDVFLSMPLGTMIHQHLLEHRIATIGLMTRDTPSHFGACTLNGIMITSFEEKPKKAQSHVVNASLYLFSKKIFHFINDKMKSLEKDLLPELAKKELLFGFFISGDYQHIE